MGGRCLGGPDLPTRLGAPDPRTFGERAGAPGMIWVNWIPTRLGAPDPRRCWRGPERRERSGNVAEVLVPTRLGAPNPKRGTRHTGRGTRGRGGAVFGTLGVVPIMVGCRILGWNRGIGKGASDWMWRGMRIF